MRPAGEITLVAGAYHPAAEPVQWPVGTRTPIAATPSHRWCSARGGPARMDSYENVGGVLAAQVRAVGIRAAVGVPVIVDGRVWGLAAVGSARPGPMPADTEVRISGFAELVASVVVAGYRDEQKRQLLGDASQRPFLIDSLLEGRPLIAGACGRLPVVCGCRPVVRSWSSPPRFPRRGARRCQRSSRSCAASTCIRRGGFNPICRSGSCMSGLSGDLTRLSAWCLGWRQIASASVRASTICATRRRLCISPR